MKSLRRLLGVIGVAGILVLGSTPNALAHPNSLSRTHITAAADRLEVAHRWQTLTLLELLPEIDTDGDGDLDPVEIADATEAIRECWSAHYSVTADVPLTMRTVSVTPTPVPFGRASPFRGYRWLEVRAVFERANESDAITRLGVTLRGYFDSSPDHLDYCTVAWTPAQPDDEAELLVLDREHPTATSRREHRATSSSFWIFARSGWDHILTGWDHLAFLAALLFATRRLRSLLGLMTAFTVAHSLTLALTVTGLVDTNGYERLIEIAIALSVAYVAADTVLHPNATRTRWPEAFGFGLLHGLGFAGFLGDALGREVGVATPLIGFNLGIEAGQATLLIAAAFVVRWLPGDRTVGEGEEAPPRTKTSLAPRWLRRSGSLLVMLCGLFWFWERL